MENKINTGKEIIDPADRVYLDAFRAAFDTNAGYNDDNDDFDGDAYDAAYIIARDTARIAQANGSRSTHLLMRESNEDQHCL